LKGSGNQNFSLPLFSDSLGQMESGNDYQKTNLISGALGKYQFMTSTLDNLKNIFSLPDWKSKENFLSDPDLQEKYFYYHCKNILSLIDNKDFLDFYGTIVNGRKRFKNVFAPANIYGIIAGCHLGGVGGCRKFVKGIKDPDDGFTSISDYVAFFSDSLKNYT
jgi:hypothetical protein